MKVGDYVRTEDGIKRVLKYKYNDYYENGHCVWFDNKDFGILYTDDEVKKMKPSSNIIDLIEVGDYVNGVLIEEIYEKGNDKLFIHTFDTEIMMCFTNNNINSIVTKEQFESVEYKVKE